MSEEVQLIQTQSANFQTFFTSLIAGGIAGTSVDVALYPLDTIKTRLQSSEGFLKAGGFRGVYSGLSIAAVGSAPGAALFFSSYELSKSFLSKKMPSEEQSPLIHMTAAALGETCACLVRVPTEIVKQRMQTGMHSSAMEAIRSISMSSGARGFYSGYFSMIAREIPFSFIQFPVWEKLKKSWGNVQGTPTTPVQGALCGSIAGCLAAAITTPLDVVKTRLMLGKDAAGRPYTTTLDTFNRVYAEEGAKRLFSGIGPRCMWISIGGFVFFGMYEKSSSIISDKFLH